MSFPVIEIVSTCVHFLHARKKPCISILESIGVPFGSLLMQKGDNLKASVVLLCGNMSWGPAAGAACAKLSLSTITAVWN